MARLSCWKSDSNLGAQPNPTTCLPDMIPWEDWKNSGFAGLDPFLCKCHPSWWQSLAWPQNQTGHNFRAALQPRAIWMSAGARHLEGSVPVLEEEQGAPLCNLAGPKFTHGFQVSLVESFVESLHERGTDNVQNPSTQNCRSAFAWYGISGQYLTCFFFTNLTISHSYRISAPDSPSRQH